MSIKSPWTNEQVEKLNEYQACGWVHEFTCPNHSGIDNRRLVATNDGWKCPCCEYTQDWAHEHMFKGAPANPIAMFGDRGKPCA